jgi:hypothetical protein
MKIDFGIKNERTVKSVQWWKVLACGVMEEMKVREYGRWASYT